MITTMLFFPYATVIPHRHPWSHLFLLGTLLRVLYISLIFWTVCLVLNRPDIFDYVWECREHWWPLLLGLAVSDALHWAMDGFPT